MKGARWEADGCLHSANSWKLQPSCHGLSAMHHGGRKNLVIQDGKMDRYRYIQILGHHMLLWARGVSRRNFCLCKTMPATCSTWHMAYLDQHDVEVMHLPAMSPDMNAIEPAWDQMSIWTQDRSSSFQSGWIALSPPPSIAAVLAKRKKTLVESMPHHTWAVLTARGGHTRY